MLLIMLIMLCTRPGSFKAMNPINPVHLWARVPQMNTLFAFLSSKSRYFI